MQNKNNERMSKKYLEIYEVWQLYEKYKIIIRFEKFLIRNTVRLLGYRIAILLIRWVEKKIPLNSKLQKYIKYILKINLYKIYSNIALGTKNLKEYIKIKKEWAAYSIDESEDTDCIETSKLYLNLIKKYCDSSLHKNQKKRIDSYAHGKPVREIYIYGPNSTKNFIAGRNDRIFCFSKPLTNKNKIPGNSILFLNSYTFQRLSMESKNELSQKYKKIFVHCKVSCIKKPFIQADFPLGSNIASPMGLMRIIYCLKRKYKNIKYEIDGFDLYTSKQAYSGHILTDVKYKEENERELVLFQSLAFHDPLFNFLYMKEEFKKINILKSQNLRKIIKKTPDQYMELLFNARKYEPEFTV